MPAHAAARQISGGAPPARDVGLGMSHMLSQRMKGRAVPMKRIAFRFSLPAILGVMFALAGCGAAVGGMVAGAGGGGGPTANEVDMASVNFVQKAITIKAGAAVLFVDPAATGSFHILCFGHNQVCAPNANGPAALNAAGGIPFSAGGPSMSIPFTTPGTYEVTCTVHPVMNVVITVK